MLPARDVGGAVRAFAVADGHVHDLEVHFCRTEYQVKIAKGVEIAEVRAIGGDLFIVFTPHHFRAAERVFHRLSQQP